MQKYRTILADPPWKQTLISGGEYKIRPNINKRVLPYQTMSLSDICALSVEQYADIGCHLWLWTTNEFLRAGFEVMEAWGFKYLAPIHWIKPQGTGNYFIHRTQTLLFGYRKKCYFNLERYLPNIIEANAGKHSQKPQESYDYIEKISDPDRLELFARPISPMFQKRNGWHVWGNEIESDVEIPLRGLTPRAADLGGGRENFCKLHNTNYVLVGYCPICHPNR